MPGEYLRSTIPIHLRWVTSSCWRQSVELKEWFYLTQYSCSPVTLGTLSYFFNIYMHTLKKNAKYMFHDYSKKEGSIKI